MTKRFMLKTLLSVSALIFLSPIPKTLAVQSVSTSLNPNLVTQSELNSKPSFQFVIAKNNYPKRVYVKDFNAALDIVKKAKMETREKYVSTGESIPICHAANLIYDVQSNIDTFSKTDPGYAQRKGKKILDQVVQKIGVPISILYQSSNNNCSSLN